jgi:tetratricopeptide (TPR) repeat protein
VENPNPGDKINLNIGHLGQGGIAIGKLEADEVHITQPERLTGSEGSGLPPSNAAQYVARGSIEDDLWQALQARQKRVVVGVSGMGGVGKTELALHLAQRANAAQPGSVLWVIIGDRLLSQVQGEMARALGIKLDPSSDEQGNAGDIRRALEHKPRLVVLDDVRKDFVPWLGLCLPPCPPCALLVTSRLHELPGLEHGEMRPLDVMDESQALELLGAHPKMARQLQLEPEAARDLAKKCAYHPLALDLALPQLHRRLDDSDTPIADYVRGMTNRLKQLKGLSDVRRSLQASFDLSYQALSAQEGQRFRQLAAFAESGFCTDAAAAIWRVDEAEALETLDGLRNASHLQRGSRKGWWRLHDLLHEYAALQLVHSGEEEAARRAQAEWIISLFDLHYVDDSDAAPDVALELENLRCAAAWALQRKDGELLARLSTTPRNWLYNYFRLWEDWQNWLRSALEMGIKDDRLKANTLKAIGDVQQFRKEIDAALESYRQALELFRAVGDRLGEANTLSSQSRVALLDGDQLLSDRLLEQAIRLYQAIGSRYSIPAQIGNHGWALRRVGKSQQARPYLLNAAELFEAMGLQDYAERHRNAAGI